MDLILEILSIPLVQSILKIAFIILLFAMPLGTVLTLMERKWSAMIQDRVGPNRANVGNYTGNGLLHLAADGLKFDFQGRYNSPGCQRLFILDRSFLRVNCRSCNFCNHSDCRADW